jgi:hypothetical protein
MQKQNSNPFSNLKTNASFYILENVLKNSEELNKKVQNCFITLTKNKNDVYYFYKNKKFFTSLLRKVNLNSIVPSKDIDQLNTYIDDLLIEEENVNLLTWYVRRVLNLADSLSTAKVCIPEYLHKHLSDLTFNGEKDATFLYVKECYDSLEEAPLKNILLGI